MRGRNLRCILVATDLVVVSAALVLVPAVAGLLASIVTSARTGSSQNVSVDELSAAPMRTEGGYTLTGGEYLAKKKLWAMLVDEGDAVVWQQGKPADVPDRYSLTDMAVFTRWYLSDYLVQVRVWEDGLLVVGGSKGSTWEHSFALDTDVLKTIPFWLAGLFLLAPLGVLGLTALVLGRQLRRERQERNFARSDWINGISHDIRTPLPMVMGCAGQLEADPVLPPRRRAQATIIRRQSQTIRDLINDLNLTTCLDHAMQPLRRRSLHPAALVRQVTADVFNGGLEGRYALTVEVSPKAEALALEGDASLPRRALLNLVDNCVRHDPEGCFITSTAVAEGEVYTLKVEDDGGGGLPVGLTGVGLTPDDGAAYGTGFRPAEQIARAHGGALELHRAVWGVLAVLRLSL